MTLLFDDLSSEPGAHVLVLGVGNYPHLEDGAGPLFPGHEHMGQLTSTALSAEKIASWFIKEFRNDSRPLRSIDVLISAKKPVTVELKDGTPRKVGRATLRNASTAIKAWKKRGDRNSANLIVLFFSGHGIARGLQQTLAMEDFGRDQDQPLNHAIDFTGLYLGLDRCGARDQVFFVDACRKASGAMLTLSQFYGWPVYYADKDIGERRAPIFYATLPSATAFGPPNAPTYFTSALLDAFRGAGADDLDEPGVWNVDTGALNNAVHFLLRRELGPSKSGRQHCTVDHETRMPIHRLTGRPVVPVDVACLNSTDTPYAVLAYHAGSRSERRDPPLPTEWPLLLESGEYVFTADMLPPRVGNGTISTPVVPPYRPVRIGIR